MNELVARTVFTAFVLADQSGATKIDLDHLLSARDTPLTKLRQSLDTATADDIRGILIPAKGTESR